MIYSGSSDLAIAAQGLRPRGGGMNSRRKVRTHGRTSASSHSRNRPTPVTVPLLLSGGAAPQNGGDPLKHLGELLALLSRERLRHTPLNAPRTLIGMQNQGLAFGGQ